MHEPDEPKHPHATDEADDIAIPTTMHHPSLGALAVRSGIGGVMMGLANLVPGISGGTMLLASGVYTRFIAAVGEVSTFKFRRHSLVVLTVVAAAAMAAVVLLAGPVKHLVVHHRWIMYSLFIGLTLGGVPVIWRLVRDQGRKPTLSLAIGAFCGFVAMAAIAILQMRGADDTPAHHGIVFMFLAGVVGAAAMILPGVSGGYLLLVMGVYVPILGGIDTLKTAVGDRDTAAMIDISLRLVLPVGIGVLVGIATVSNVLRWLLEHFERVTLGVLLGLLLGAVVGLWPFQEPVDADTVTMIKGQTVSIDEAGVLIFTDKGEPVATEDLPTRVFTPSALQVVTAIGLIVVGFGVTLSVDHIGRDKPAARPEPAKERRR